MLKPPNNKPLQNENLFTTSEIILFILILKNLLIFSFIKNSCSMENMKVLYESIQIIVLFISIFTLEYIWTYFYYNNSDNIFSKFIINVSCLAIYSVLHIWLIIPKKFSMELECLTFSFF